MDRKYFGLVSCRYVLHVSILCLIGILAGNAILVGGTEIALFQSEEAASSDVRFGDTDVDSDDDSSDETEAGAFSSSEPRTVCLAPIEHVFYRID